MRCENRPKNRLSKQTPFKVKFNPQVSSFG